MNRLNIKPLSVNDAWKGRKFKSDEYKVYEEEVFYTLPRLKIPEGKLKLTITGGFSSSGSDVDNIVKPFLDILQKRYQFNDSRVYMIVALKDIVKKGDEYIEFLLEPFMADLCNLTHRTTKRHHKPG